MSLANSSCGSEIGQTLRGLNSDKVRIFLFHRKFQKSLKSTNFEHVKTLNSSLWKSKTEVTRKNFGMEKKKYDLAAGTLALKVHIVKLAPISILRTVE